MQTEDYIKIMERVRPLVDDYGNEHWMWTGGIANRRTTKGNPVMHFSDYPGKKDISTSVRRELFVFINDREIEAAKPGCGLRCCVSPACIVERPPASAKDRAYTRMLEKDRILNGPRRVSNKPTRLKLRYLIDELGMSVRQIEAALGTGQNSLLRHANGDYTMIHRDIAAKVLAFNPERVEFSHQTGHRGDATGSARRLRGMIRDGFPQVWINERLHDGRRSNLERLLTGDYKQVTPAMAARIDDLYRKLENSQPSDFLIPQSSQRRAATFAKKNGWAPRHCWDDETIDDPSAIAEWTGRCGTVAGYQIHRREGHVFLQKRAASGCGYQQFFACAPCRKAAHEANVGRQRKTE